MIMHWSRWVIHVMIEMINHHDLYTWCMSELIISSYLYIIKIYIIICVNHMFNTSIYIWSVKLVSFNTVLITTITHTVITIYAWSVMIEMNHHYIHRVQHVMISIYTLMVRSWWIITCITHLITWSVQHEMNEVLYISFHHVVNTWYV